MPTQQLKASLAWICACLRACPPRELRLFAADERPTLLYTDGWGDADTQRWRIGAVLDSPHATELLYTGADVPNDVLNSWLPKRQHINQTELLAGPVAFDTWPTLLQEADIIHWVDNDAAAAALIKGYSDKSDSLKIISDYWLRALSLRANIFIDRVESKSNLADAPSRPDESGMALLHRLRARACAPKCDFFQSARPSKDPFQWYDS